LARFTAQEISQFRGAELAAADAGIHRSAMEAFALESHRRALHARSTGVLDEYLLPVGPVGHDEVPRADTSLEKMASLPPLLPGGSITAAVSSQISDGAAALVLASAEAVARYELTPLARVVATAVVGSDPVRMVTGPPAATRKVLARAQLDIADIDLFEVNEAFASVVLAWLAETGARHETTNVNGGAIALGHPLGATGARMMCDMIAELRSSDGRYALQTMCEGAGTASASVIERC
jgi:acetyl-CoA C-acetyltransferase